MSLIYYKINDSFSSCKETGKEYVHQNFAIIHGDGFSMVLDIEEQTKRENVSLCSLSYLVNSGTFCSYSSLVNRSKTKKHWNATKPLDKLDYTFSVIGFFSSFATLLLN